MHRSVIPSFFVSNFLALIPTPSHLSFDLSASFNDRHKKCQNTPIAKVRAKFRECSSFLIGQDISVYTDGSKIDANLAVGSAIFIPELGLAFNSSVFTAEAWAL